ncbi:MAG: NusA antitermination factor, N utilization substance protein A [Candidatus Peregrinibacteria bacterium GW2011_GWE2_39_6]|nr:MAG: NusA antitermination factor, N utilization substance protein A [Candidatus Peregrinibacteria bacterium GW2011_GWF2_39_17]KKR25380.1 MAG: NusA antitermination factor, N utilization substance protein A [Candidatus Peregrinibacteria bacterium GW2011_GWE2_39_6]HCW32442.1 transcription termination/antitermination protein NusA [Candidatus Peregrinibacteria bacterium]
MQSQFLRAINELCEEKNLSKEIVFETVKAALRAAYRKDYGNRDQNIEVEFNDGETFATIFLIKEVVKTIENEDQQISLKEAQKNKKTAKIGDTIKIDVTPISYGRIAAQSAKQVILQKLQEAERDTMYEMFKDRENELINSLVHRVDERNVYVDLGGITTFLPTEHQIPGERYYGGQRIKLYLDKVIKTTKGPQLLISRTHPNLVKKLMELDIPEIKEGIVTIKGVARDPGIRCKVAVSSSDPKVDAIGACVGQKGVRVQAVMDELNGERIDIIPYSEESAKYISSALAPAKVTHIKLDDHNRRAGVYVAQDQRPLAIGRQGQNVRLASNLTGWEIDILDVIDLSQEDIKSTTEGEKATAPQKSSVAKVSDLPKITPEIIAKLEKVNLMEIAQLKGLSEKDFLSIEGITGEEAKIIVKAIKGNK